MDSLASGFVKETAACGSCPLSVCSSFFLRLFSRIVFWYWRFSKITGSIYSPQRTHLQIPNCSASTIDLFMNHHATTTIALHVELLESKSQHILTGILNCSRGMGTQNQESGVLLDKKIRRSTFGSPGDFIPSTICITLTGK